MKYLTIAVLAGAAFTIMMTKDSIAADYELHFNGGQAQQECMRAYNHLRNKLSNLNVQCHEVSSGGGQSVTNVTNTTVNETKNVTRNVTKNKYVTRNVTKNITKDVTPEFNNRVTALEAQYGSIHDMVTTNKEAIKDNQAGIAGIAAMNGIATVPGSNSIGFGVAQYGDQQSVAISSNVWLNGSTVAKVGAAATTRGAPVFNAGVTFTW